MNRVLLLVLLSISFCSCQKGQEFLDNEDGAEINNSLARNQKILSFSSWDEMQDTLNMLLQSSEENQLKWYQEKNFKSLDNLFCEASDELEDIQNSSSYEDYLSKYKSFVKKYSPYFLFNDQDSTDLNPYIATNKTLIAHIADINGNLMINDSIVNINTIKKITDLNKYKIEQSASSPQTKGTVFEEMTNSLLIKTANNKMWAEVELLGAQVYIKYSSHKKGIFGGWNNRQRKYSTRYISSEPKNWTYSVRFEELMRIAPKYETTPSIPSGTSIRMGSTRSYSNINDKAVATFQIYSDGVGSHNPGYLRIKI